MSIKSEVCNWKLLNLNLTSTIIRGEVEMKQKRIYVTKIFSFEAAHKLIHYEGTCQNLHGHSYELEVTISGSINDRGIVLDFKDLKMIVNNAVVDRLDHSYLNDVFDFEDTTAENIISFIWDELRNALQEKHNAANNLCLERVRLYETKTCYVEINRENEL